MTMSPAVATTFERMLAVGRRAFMATTIDEMLCRATGVNRQQDWPLAQLAALADGLALPAQQYVLFAQPVHLQLQRDSFTIAPETLHFEKAEAEALVALLNQHFSQEGLEVMVSPHCPHRWYLKVQLSPAIQTTPLDMAMGRDIRPLLPHGRDAAFWNAFLNEVQMLLFEHPLNQAREARGELPVSGVWVYGGGELPPASAITLPVMFTDDAVVSGLAALHAGTYQAGTYQEVPQDMGALLQYDVPQAWLVPGESADAVVHALPLLWHALRDGGLRELELNIALGDKVLQCRMNKWDSYKFWRKSRPWTEMLGG